MACDVDGTYVMIFIRC